MHSKTELTFNSLTDSHFFSRRREEEEGEVDFQFPNGFSRYEEEQGYEGIT